MKQLLHQYKWYLAVIFLISFTVIGVRLTTVSVYDGGKARNHIFGDGFSDINTISSAKYFLDSGFTQTKLLPVHDYYPEATNPNVYTHYPALPNILAGAYATVFQTANESVLRIIPTLLAMLFFFFIYYVLNELLKNPLQAFIGGSVIVLSNYFIAWADNLHQHLYGEFLKWIYFYLLYKYHESEKRSLVNFIPMLVIMMLEVNISFEQPVYLGILTLGFSLIYKRSVFTFETISAGVAVLAGFGLHVWQNALYFGNWTAAIEDMKSALFLRTAGVETSAQQAEQAFTPADYWQIPFNWFNRLERYFLFPGWAMLLVAYFALKDLKQSNNKLYKVMWALFFASVAWTICMAQHAFIHTFTSKHFSILYAFTAAVGLPILYHKLTGSFRQKQYISILFYVLISCYMIAMLITQQIIPLYVECGLAYSGK